MNYRNTVEVLDFAYRFASAYLDQSEGSEDMPLVHPEFGGRNGAKPEVHHLASEAQELEQLTCWLKQRAQSGIPLRQMAVLCRYNYQVDKMREGLARSGIAVDAETSQSTSPRDKAYAPSSDTVKVLTMHSSKGLEFNSIAIPNLGCMPCTKSTPEEEARLLYVALTRATENVLLTYHSESAFTRQCEALRNADPL